MATARPAHGLQGPLAAAKQISGWHISVAVLFIVLGMFAIIEPGVAGLGVTVLVGWLLTSGGVTHLIAAFKGDGEKQMILRVIIGIVYLIVGLYFVTHPRLAIGTLTLLLASALLVGGVLEIIAYFRSKGEGSSKWMLLNGMVALVLAEMIWFEWPSSSVWAIGILVGINLLMTGMTGQMFGLAARNLVRELTGSEKHIYVPAFTTSLVCLQYMITSVSRRG